MTEEDCRIANLLRPDYAGFVFARTRHFVSDETATLLRAALDPVIPAVGVFVDEDVDHVAALVRKGIIQMVQLHGQEDETYIAALRERLAEETGDGGWRGADQEGSPAFSSDAAVWADSVSQGSGTVPQIPRIIRAVRVRDGSEIARAKDLPCDVLLLDTWAPDTPGGSGKRFDLSLVPEMKKPWILAGGLMPENVGGVLSEVLEGVKKTGGKMPFAVDVSSGVESEAAGGHKDEARVRAFIASAKAFGGRKADA